MVNTRWSFPPVCQGTSYRKVGPLGPGISINLEKMPSSGSRVLARCVPHAILITGYVVDEDDQLLMTCRSPAGAPRALYLEASRLSPFSSVLEETWHVVSRRMFHDTLSYVFVKKRTHTVTQKFGASFPQNHDYCRYKKVFRRKLWENWGIQFS